MHPLLSAPYAAVAGAANLLARLPLGGDGKAWRALRARAGVLERLERWAAGRRDPTRPLLWMHAPSVGEGLQARPVLERIRARHPDWQLAYTFFSPSAERFAASLDVDVADYLPFDTADAAQRLLDALRPTALVFAKLDLWPRLAEAASARGVALGMVSATLSEGSGRSGALARALLHDAYAALDAVGTIDVADGARLAALGVRADRVRVTGDTRFDQVAARAAATDRASALLAPLVPLMPLGDGTSADGARPTLVAGSTWPADETVLLPAWRALRADVPTARLVIAPHEPTAPHCAPIESWARAAGLSFARLAEARAAHDVVLVDRVGVLGELYALATVAFVGGGFHAAGLHSVLEPAAFGAPVLFGPRHGNSRDAGLLIAARGAEAVADEATLTEALRIVLTEPDTRAHAGAAALQVVRTGLGAADRSTALVEQLVLSTGR
jgi:3-deoxy-D-manno-octulosonic-acid transferase